MQFDIVQKYGEIIIEESTQVHQADILVMHEGHHKFAPLRGVGVVKYINSDNKNSEFLQKINQHFLSDNLPTNNLEIDIK